MQYINFIKNIDFIGQKPIFYIENKENFKTITGGVLYIIIVLLALAGFFSLGRDLWERQIPDVNFTEEFDDMPPEFLMNYENFNIHLGIQNPANSNYFIDKRIYELTGTLHQMYNNGSIFQTSLPMVKCSPELFGKNNKELFMSAYSDDVWCLDSSKLDGLNMTGTFGNPLYETFRIQVFQCRNTTSYNSCLPQEIIDQYLKGTYFSIRYINNLVNTKNFSEPFERVLDDDFFVISNTYYKELNMYLRKVDIASDIGFIFESMEQKSAMQLNHIKEQIDFRSQNNEMMRLIIRLFTKRTVINRKYIKIQTLLAQVGGLVKFILMCFQFVYFFYSKHFYYEHLINQVLTPQTENYVSSSPQFNPPTNTKIIDEPSSHNMVIRSTFKRITDGYDIKKKNSNKESVVNEIQKVTPHLKLARDTTKQKSLNVKFKWYEILCLLKCVKDQNKIDLLKLQSILKNKLDIIHYLKLSEDMEEIKEKVNSANIPFDRNR